MTYYLLRRAHHSGDMIVENSKHLKLIKADDPTPNDIELLVRWGTTKYMGNPKVLNKTSAIQETSDKKAFRLKLEENNLCPITWGSYADYVEYRLDSSWSGAVLVRPAHHLRSEDMYICENHKEVKEIVKQTKMDGGYYISQFIEKAHEYRVYVVQNRIVAIIEKIPNDKSAASWGCVTEGVFKYVPWNEWPLKVCQNAHTAFSCCSLDFGAIDIITDNEDNAYTLEINTAPAMTPYPAKKFANAFDWIIENARDRLELEGSADKVSSYRHPSLV